MQIEALLDESTAELAKLEFSPVLSTIEANFQLKKPLPLHTTVRIDCQVSVLENMCRKSANMRRFVASFPEKDWVQVTRISGVRCWVSGSISLPATRVVLATCEAQLVDLRRILALKRPIPVRGLGNELEA